MQLKEDDILSLQTADESPTQTKTFEVGELKEVLRQRLGAASPEWFGEGVLGKCLSTTQGQWVEGRVSIAIEFTPVALPNAAPAFASGAGATPAPVVPPPTA